MSPRCNGSNLQPVSNDCDQKDIIKGRTSHTAHIAIHLGSCTCPCGTLTGTSYRVRRFKQTFLSAVTKDVPLKHPRHDSLTNRQNGLFLNAPFFSSHATFNVTSYLVKSWSNASCSVCDHERLSFCGGGSYTTRKCTICTRERKREWSASYLY